jgi:hypothetical protein
MIRDQRRVGTGQGRAEGNLAQICAALTRSFQRGGLTVDGRLCWGCNCTEV